MRKEILINSTSDEVRIAITEDGRLSEFFIESPDNSRNVGDIYLGKIAKVLPGIRAAFINVGFPQDAFLHFSDIDNTFEDYSSIIGDDSDIDDDDDDEEETPQKPAGRNQHRERFNPAQTLIPGQDIIVQITKEPVGKKGLRVTSKVSIPGRYLVLMPFNGRIGISRKIYNPREKRRLKSIVRANTPREMGVIIRTVAAGQDDSLILDDLNKLLKSWSEIQNKMKTQKSPVIVYKDASTTSSVIRDLFRDDVSRMVINSKKLHKEIKNYIEQVSPESANKIDLYSDSVPLFDAMNIEKQIEELTNKKVWLKNSGYIVIETTEAMTVIDVNSGKYAKSQNQEENSLKINFDAAREIVRQCRLRDIGGIIVADFIDLYEDNNKKKLYEEMKKEFRRDRAKVTLLPMSDFGLIEITRQRIRQNLIHRVSDSCILCKGTGRVQSRSGFMNEIERWVQRFKSKSNTFSVKLSINPLQKYNFLEGFINNRMKLLFRYRILLNIETDDELGLDEFRFLTKENIDITEEFNSIKNE